MDTLTKEECEQVLIQLLAKARVASPNEPHIREARLREAAAVRTAIKLYEQQNTN